MGEVIKKIIKKEKGRLFSVCLFLLGLAGLLFFCQIYFLNNKADNQPLPEIFSADPTDKDFYETAFGFEKKKVDFSTPPLAMIVPHHLLAADLIAEAFSNLKAEDYETVILISPNHFNVGEGKIISAGENWETPYGILEADRKLFSELEKSGEISDEKEVFAGEHGIRAEVSFIKKILPEAEILPRGFKIVFVRGRGE
jgi:AmmeMemoRadiSam system protein B